MRAMTDAEIIQALGGPTVLARRLGLSTPDGSRRVHNWIKRGIPAKVRLENPRVFKVRATAKDAALAMEMPAAKSAGKKKPAGRRAVLRKKQC